MILSAFSVQAAGQNGSVLFESFEVLDHKIPDSPTFIFSAAHATSDNPVVISVAGRKLSKADRRSRVSLQNHWLSVNVPDTLEFQDRALVTCGPKREGEFSACDRYAFVDPKTHSVREYYIYVGNWP
jgi:hypothetical protein